MTEKFIEVNFPVLYDIDGKFFAATAIRISINKLIIETINDFNNVSKLTISTVEKESSPGSFTFETDIKEVIPLGNGFLWVTLDLTKIDKNIINTLKQFILNNGKSNKNKSKNNNQNNLESLEKENIEDEGKDEYLYNPEQLMILNIKKKKKITLQGIAGLPPNLLVPEKDKKPGKGPAPEINWELIPINQDNNDENEENSDDNLFKELLGSSELKPINNPLQLVSSWDEEAIEESIKKRLAENKEEKKPLEPPTNYKLVSKEELPHKESATEVISATENINTKTKSTDEDTGRYIYVDPELKKRLEKRKKTKNK